MSVHHIHVNIGEIAVSREPAVISTVLGSCVSVCLFSSNGVGGMIHFALPRQEGALVSDRDLRYGEVAVPFLISQVSEISGLPPSHLKAKIVGGAAVVKELRQAAQIGNLNIETAERLLKEAGVTIVARDVAGIDGRKVVFYSDSGRLRVAPVKIEGSDRVMIIPPVFPGFEKTAFTEVTSRIIIKKRVLIIDDSKTIQDLLKKVLSEDDRLEVVGVAPNPMVAEKMIAALKPDVLTLDVHMPGMDGVIFLERLLPRHPIPTVMITSIGAEESDHIFRALELGAVDYLQKPSLEELPKMAGVIRDKVFSAAMVVRIRQSGGKKFSRSRSAIAAPAMNAKRMLIAIGASTGGTEALKDVLIRLPKSIPPIVIVQHIPPVFSTAFSRRLNDLCEFEVKEAQNGDLVRAGRALVAPGGRQMAIVPGPEGFKIRITDDPPVCRHKPSVDFLFQSVAQHAGARAIGIILTGMGSDGAEGLLKMRQAGARTIGQDEESCVVYGMPRVAHKLGAVEAVHSLEDIPAVLLHWLTKKNAA